MVKYFFFFFFFIVIQAIGQIEFKGRILDNDKNALVGAAVQIFNSDTSKLIDYTYTDFDGNWEIDNIKLKDLIVVAKYLGYVDSYKPLNDIVSDYTLPTIILFPKDYYLNTVSIKAKRFDFVVKGDTILYNINPLRDSTDFYLEDVLQKIPELEIKEGKQIYFKGKKVDKVLVEGKDLYNNKHQFFLQSFAPKDINKIEIIQDYQDFADRFNKAQRKKTAINVKLKESSKGVIKIISESAVGYNNKYEHNTNLYYIKNRFGFNSYFKANNRGESDLNIMDFLRLDITKVDKLGSNIDRLVPQGFKLPIDLTKNHDNVIALNVEYKLDKRRITRFSVLGSHLNRYNNSDVFRSYLTTNAILRGEKNGKSIFRYVDESFSTKLLFSDNFLLDIRLPFRYINSFGNSNLQDIEQFGRFSTYNNKYRNINFDPDIFVSYKVMDVFRLRLGNRLSYYTSKIFNQYTDTSIDTIIGFDNDVQKSLIDNTIFLSLRYKENNLNWNFQHDFNTISNSFNSTSRPIFSLFDLKRSMQDEIHKSKVHLYSKIEKFVISGNIEIVERHKREINDLWNFMSYFSSKLYLGYDFSIMKGFGISFAYNKNPFSFDEIANVSFLKENKIITKGIIPFDELKSNKSLNINYYNFESEAKYKIFCNTTYSVSDKPLVYSTESLDGFIIMNSDVGKKSNNFSSTVDVKRLFKKVIDKVGFKFEFNHNIIKKSNTDVFKLTNYNFKLNFDFKYGKNMELKSGYNYSFSSHMIENINTIYSIHKPHIEFIFKDKKILVNNEFLYEWNIVSQKSLSYPQWNLNIRYLINSNLAIYIKGKDMLNFHGKQYRYFILNDQFIDIRNYIKFPGFVLIGIHYST